MKKIGMYLLLTTIVFNRNIFAESDFTSAFKSIACGAAIASFCKLSQKQSASLLGFGDWLIKKEEQLKAEESLLNSSEGCSENKSENKFGYYLFNKIILPYVKNQSIAFDLREAICSLKSLESSYKSSLLELHNRGFIKRTHPDIQSSLIPKDKGVMFEEEKKIRSTLFSAFFYESNISWCYYY